MDAPSSCRVAQLAQATSRLARAAEASASTGQPPELADDVTMDLVGAMASCALLLEPQDRPAASYAVATGSGKSADGGGGAKAGSGGGSRASAAVADWLNVINRMLAAQSVRKRPPQELARCEQPISLQCMQPDTHACMGCTNMCTRRHNMCHTPDTIPTRLLLHYGGHCHDLCDFPKKLVENRSELFRRGHGSHGMTPLTFQRSC